MIMTCCEADMSFIGFICGYPKAYELDDREWVEISGIVFATEFNKNGKICKLCLVDRRSLLFYD